MSQYGGSNEQIQDYLHGYGPSKGAGQRSLSRAGDAPAGESASYDKLPHNQYHHENRPPHHASYGKPSQSFVGDSQTLYDQPSRPHRSNTKSRIQEAERNVADFFYKKPDPTYAGMYGTDYEPQISKTKVVAASATVAALMYGFSQYKKRKENKKKFEKYTHSHHSRRSKKTAASTVGREDSHDGRSKY